MLVTKRLSEVQTPIWGSVLAKSSACTPEHLSLVWGMAEGWVRPDVFSEVGEI